MPNNTRIISEFKGKLKIPESLTDEARKAYAFKGIAHSLVSIGKICDTGFTAEFTKEKLAITKNGKTIWKGKRDPISKMWMLPLRNPSVPVNTGISNNAYKISRKQDLVNYLHADCFSPVKSTWIEAVENDHFGTWPGLTTELIRKYLKRPEATYKGHMKQTRQNMRSTKHNNPPVRDPDPPGIRTNLILVHTIERNEISIDLTGRFPIRSFAGNEYIFVLYDYDSNPPPRGSGDT